MAIKVFIKYPLQIDHISQNLDLMNISSFRNFRIHEAWGLHIFFPQPWGIFGQTRNSDSGGPVMTGPRSHYGIVSIMLVIIVRYVSLICINHWVWIIVRNYEVPLFVVESSLTFVPTTSMSLYHQDFISMNMWNAFCGIRTIHN